MVNWQITATTIYCDAVDDEVTVIVYKDGSMKRSGYRKYYQPNKEASRLLLNKSKGSKRLGCEKPECHRVIEYKTKLFTEEAKKGVTDNQSLP